MTCAAPWRRSECRRRLPPTGVGMEARRAETDLFFFFFFFFFFKKKKKKFWAGSVHESPTPFRGDAPKFLRLRVIGLSLCSVVALDDGSVKSTFSPCPSRKAPMQNDLYDIRAMIDVDGKYVLTAHGKVLGAQPFWFSDQRYDSGSKHCNRQSSAAPRPRGLLHN